MDAKTFLNTIFAECNGIPVTVSSAEGFKARRWRHDTEPPQGPVYFCISTVKDIPRASVLRRQAADLVETCAVVLDDVGTKVSRETIRLSPSYKLETSPGNEHWGYILETPVAPDRAAALIEALAAAGLTDAGAKRADRIMRIPGSLNEKFTPPFPARLLEWHPDRLFTFSELATGLGVVPTDTQLSAGPQPLEEGASDPELRWMADHDMVLGGPNPRGWYAVRCPQEALHTGDVDHGTDYMPGRPGTFKCMHAHCQDFNTAALRAWIRARDPAVELGPIGREELITLGERLAGALGLNDFGHGNDHGNYHGDDHPRLEGDLARLRAALQAQTGPGTLFHRPSRGQREMSPAQALAAILAEVPLDPQMLPSPDMTAGGKIAQHQATNDARVHHVMDLIGMDARVDVLSGKIEGSFHDAPGFDPRQDVSHAAEATLIYACNRCGLRDKQGIREGLSNRAEMTPYNPVSEWIQSAAWDGKDRLESLLGTVTMHDQSAQARRWKRIVLRRWCIQVIAGIRNWERGDDPTDIGHVLVLQGPQGANKSHWLASLMPSRWITLGVNLSLDKNERDAVKRSTMTPITELAELDASFRRSDTAALKNFLTTRMDIYRPAYGRHEVARARMTSFGATINPRGFLIDPTGERRFWPLAVEHCEDRHGIDLQQLWAEVWEIHASGEPFWLQPGELELHERFSSEHHAASDVNYVMEDLKVRTKAFLDQGLWVHVNAKELCRHYGLRGSTALYTDLTSALERAKYRGARVRGKSGFYVPPYEVALTPAQQAGFRVLLGAKEDVPEGTKPKL